MVSYTRSGNKNQHKGTQKNYNNKKKPVLIIGLIYANWCGHCQALKPEWKKMKGDIKRSPMYKSGQCKFAEIENSDPTKQRKMAIVNKQIKGGNVSANGFPTIYKVKNGNIEYYQGGRSSQEMKNWFMDTDYQAPMQKQEDLREEQRNYMPLLNRIFGGTRKNRVRKN